MKTLYKTLFAMLLTAFSTNAFSGSVVTVPDVKFTPGKTASIDIYLDNTDPAINFIQFDLTLPEGVHIGDTKSDMTISYYRGIKTNSEISYYEGAYTFVLEADGMEDTKGKFISIQATFDEDFEGGEAKLTEVITAGDEENDLSDQTITFNFVKATSETVEIALGNASGYNTYVSDKDLDFTGLDAKAYIVSAVSATEATLKAVTTIKAGEGFIIEGAGEATIEVPVAAETPAASGTLLATGQPSEGDYLLATDGSAFVLWNGEGTLAATKAYLPASAISSGAKIINIAFGESTGISEVQKSKADGAIYNLSGMRVSKTQKGVYIMNGRKVIVK